VSTLDPLRVLGAALAANRQTAIVYARPDGGVSFWNAGAEVLFGHSRDDALRSRVDLIVPEEYRAMHWAGFARAIGSAWRGSAAWGPVEALHKSGQRLSLEVFLTPVQEAGERPVGVLALFRVPLSGPRHSPAE